MKSKKYIYKKKKQEKLPGNEKGFIQIVENIDNQVIIGHTLNRWSWKLPIYQNPLPFSNNKYSSIKISYSSSVLEQSKTERHNQSTSHSSLKSLSYNYSYMSNPLGDIQITFLKNTSKTGKEGTCCLTPRG